jgi:hypothetical protein
MAFSEQSWPQSPAHGEGRRWSPTSGLAPFSKAPQNRNNSWRPAQIAQELSEILATPLDTVVIDSYLSNTLARDANSELCRKYEVEHRQLPL